MSPLKINLFILGLLFTVCTFGQVEKEKLKESFDTLFYNSDSSNLVACHLKKGICHGYAIQYINTGSIWVGKYKKGKQDGVWLCSNSRHFSVYKNGVVTNFYADWDTEKNRKRAEQNFWTSYWKAVNVGKTNNK